MIRNQPREVPVRLFLDIVGDHDRDILARYADAIFNPGSVAPLRERRQSTFVKHACRLGLRDDRILHATVFINRGSKPDPALRGVRSSDIQRMRRPARETASRCPPS